MTSPGSSPRSRRFALALLAGLAGLVGPTLGQALAEPAHWVALVDASSSVTRRDSGRLRDEVLTLTETILHADAQMQERPNRLLVYFFGRGVAPMDEPIDIAAMPDRPMRHDEQWWASQVTPAGMNERTEIHEALAAAVRYLDGLPVGTERHLLLISDGELDVNGSGRDTGAPPAPEEIDRYRKLLDPDQDPVRWLRTHDVKLDTLAVLGDDNPVAGEEWQRGLTRLLHEAAPGTPWASLRALALIRSGRLWNGQRPVSEGAYVMHALAQTVGGRSNSWNVTPNTLLTVVTKAVLGDIHPGDRVTPPQTNEVILFAGTGETKFFRYTDESGQIDEAAIDSDGTLNPRSAFPRLQVRTYRTTRTVTHQVSGPVVAVLTPPLAPGGGGPAPDQDYLVYSVSNLERQWALANAESIVYRGVPTRLALSVRVRNGAAGQIEFWRTYFEQHPPEAPRVRVSRPDGQPLDLALTLAPTPPGGQEVLRLETAAFTETEVGTLSVLAGPLIFDDPERPHWELPVDAQGFQVDPLPPGDLRIEWLDTPTGPGLAVVLKDSARAPETAWREALRQTGISAEMRARDAEGLVHSVVLAPAAASAPGFLMQFRAPHPGELGCGPLQVTAALRLDQQSEPARPAPSERPLNLECGIQAAEITVTIEDDGQPLGHLILGMQGAEPLALEVNRDHPVTLKARLQTEGAARPPADASLEVRTSDDASLGALRFPPENAQSRAPGSGFAVSAVDDLVIPAAALSQALELDLVPAPEALGLERAAGVLRLNPRDTWWRSPWLAAFLAAVALATVLRWLQRRRMAEVPPPVAPFVVDHYDCATAERTWRNPRYALYLWVKSDDELSGMDFAARKPDAAGGAVLEVRMNKGRRFSMRAILGQGWEVAMTDRPDGWQQARFQPIGTNKTLDLGPDETKQQILLRHGNKQFRIRHQGTADL